MISVVERRRLRAQPDRVWRFFADEVEDRYTEWHPEHLRWKWLRGAPLEAGSVWFADEWIGRRRIQGRFIVAGCQRGESFSYRLTFPASLVRAGGSFRLEPRQGGGCELIQDVHVGFSIPLLGRFVDLVIRWVMPVEEIRRHMREEQANLEALLGASPSEETSRSEGRRHP
jgi:hypothetical protein